MPEIPAPMMTISMSVGDVVSAMLIIDYAGLMELILILFDTETCRV